MKYIHENTSAYHAGKLTAVLYNVYRKRNDLPKLPVCLVNFLNLKTIFGKYYTLLNINKKTHSYVSNYENFVNLINNKNKGNYSDFMIGYAEKINKVKVK